MQLYHYLKIVILKFSNNMPATIIKTEIPVICLLTVQPILAGFCIRKII